MKIIEKFPNIVNSENELLVRPLVSEIEVHEFGRLSGEIEASKNAILVGEDVGLLRVLQSMSHTKVQHFLQVNRPGFFREIISTCMIIKRAETFLENPVPFFVNNFNGHGDYRAQLRKFEIDLSTMDEKIHVVEGMRKFLEKYVSTKNLWSVVTLVIDELLSNALIHGPADTQVMDPRSVRLFLAHDNERLIVGCEDQYGSMKNNEVIEHLASLYALERPPVRKGNEGAGLGLKMIIDRCASFFSWVKPGEKTTVFAVLDLRKGFRGVDDPYKHLHFSLW